MQDYQAIITGASKDFGVPVDIIRSVIAVESSGNPMAVGSAGEKGLMQLMPGTARDLGVSNAFDPVQNIRAGTKYLSQQYKTAGNWRDALARYNAGKYYAGSQGQGYADKVIEAYRTMNNEGSFTPILDAAKAGKNPAAVISGEGLEEAAGGAGSGSWLDKIVKWLIANAVKIMLAILAALVMIFGIWKLINS